MSRSEKIMMLVVLMFAYAVSDLQKNFNISDPNSTTSLLKDPQRKESRSTLSSCNEIHVNSSRCNDSLHNEPFDMKSKWEEIAKELELVLQSPVTTVFIPSIYTLIFITSVPLNICAVLVFVRRLKPLKAASIYMMNLACADLLFAITLPFKIFYNFNRNNWIFGSAMCRLVSAAFFWNMNCSVQLITCISVDRLLAVVYPVKSLTWRSPRKAVIICVAIWVQSFSGSVLYLFKEQTYLVERLNITTCSDVIPFELFEFYKVYFIIFCCLFFILPLVITAVSYTRVIVTLSKTQPGVPGHNRKKRRAIVLASTVLVMFVICFTPMNCLAIASLLDHNHASSLSMLLRVFLCLGSVNCILDPLVYYFGSSKFQKELSSMLGRHKTSHSSHVIHSAR